MSEERLAYRFAPVERRGLLGQLPAGQAGVVAGGAVAGVAILDQEPTGAGAFLGAVAFGAALSIAFAPIGRRTPEEWAPIALSFAVRWARRRLRFRSRAPTAGTLGTERADEALPAGAADHPNEAPPSGAADHPNEGPPSGA